MATTAPSEDSGKHVYWDSQIEAVYQTPDGNFASALEIFSRGHHASRLNKEPVGSRFIRRMHHGVPIVKDGNGWAYCPVCKLIFNCNHQDDDRPEKLVMSSGYTPVVRETTPRAENNERNKAKSAKRFLKKISGA